MAPVPVPVRIAAGSLSLAALAGLVATMALWAPPSLWTEVPRRAWWMGWWIGAAVWVGAYGARWAAAPPPGRGRGGWRRHGAVWLVVLAMAVWAGHGAAKFWLKSDFWFGVARSHLWVMLVLTGLALALAGWRTFTGDRPHCRRCRYEKAEPAGPVCPECGCDWSRPRGVVLGIPRWRWGRLSLGVLILISVYPARRLVEQYPPARLGTGIAALLPSDALILLATPEGADGRIDGYTWAVLGRRQLTPAQEARLARRLLASRDWRGVVSHVAEPWLLSAATEGRVPPEIREAYFDGIASPALVASHWPDGPGAEVAIGGAYRPRYSRRGTAQRQEFEARLYVGEFTVTGAAAGDGVVPVRQRYRLGDPAGKGGILSGKLFPRGMGPSVRFVPPESGAAVVKATAWLVYVSDPPLTTPAQEWNDDGTPRLPAEVLWSKKVELVLAVERR